MTLKQILRALDKAIDAEVDRRALEMIRARFSGLGLTRLGRPPAPKAAPAKQPRQITGIEKAPSIPKRRVYADEFKRRALKRAYSGKERVIDVASDMGITPQLIHNWRSLRKNGGAPVVKASPKQKTQGQYMAVVRDLHAADKKLVKALVVKEGVEAGLKLARDLAAKAE